MASLAQHCWVTYPLPVSHLSFERLREEAHRIVVGCPMRPLAAPQRLWRGGTPSAALLPSGSSFTDSAERENTQQLTGALEAQVPMQLHWFSNGSAYRQTEANNALQAFAKIH